MTKEKLQSEVKTLEVFFTKYCSSKHQHQSTEHYTLKHRNYEVTSELHLCKECHELIAYSFNRLQNCPYKIKPKCRKCDNPCYNRYQWKKVAKIMRYNGLRMGAEKILRVFTA